MSELFTPTAEAKRRRGVVQDDRTPAQMHTHPVLIGGTDTFLSGWGQAPVTSLAYWACKREHRDSVLAWVRSRGDISKVRTADTPPHPGRGGHCHVYVVTDEHPALRGAS